MFSPILRDFKEADQGYNTTDTDLDAHWKKSQHKYIANARIIRSARDLERLSKFPSYDNNHIRRAYENLLANQGLEVEISTQRAIEVAILPPSEEDLEAAVKAVEYALECGNDGIIFREHRLTFEIFTVYCLKIFPDIKKENEKIDDYLKEKISDQVKKYSISKNEDVVNKINEIVNEMDSIKKLKKETNDEINKVVSYGWSGLLAKSIDKAIRTRQLSETYNTFANEIRVMAVAVQLSEAEKTKLANEIRERERAENMRPARQKCLLTIAFTVLTIIVATVLVIYGYELFGNLDTWGTPFDWLTAFVVGILAERLEKPTTNLIDSIAEAIKKLGKGEEVGGGGEAAEAEASAEG
jgi:hypothetical protein